MGVKAWESCVSEAGAGVGNNLSTPDTAVREEGFIVTVESGGEIDVEEPTDSQDLNTDCQATSELGLSLITYYEVWEE